MARWTEAGMGTDPMRHLPPCSSTAKQSGDRSGGAREGQALLEFAVVALVLALMLFGVLEFGRAYFASIAVTNAARDGARVAMDPSRSNAEVRSAADHDLHNGPNANPAADNAAGSTELTDVVIERSFTVGNINRVTAIVDFETSVPLISEIWGGGPLRISYTATSRVGWE